MTPVPETAERDLEQHGILDLRDHLGGKPGYPDRAGVEAPWRFFFCLGGLEDDGPYFLNFGYGRGFAYLSADRLEGRFSIEAAWTRAPPSHLLARSVPRTDVQATPGTHSGAPTNRSGT
ncbi:hypothetical protein ABT040_35675 [Streptomyces sp. NPDC002688]|uniref:hypothetical protein n=1 Tax=Streptomyces sp. NPDC002688 TaxID=3154423 RepID=UPI003328E3DC